MAVEAEEMTGIKVVNHKEILVEIVKNNEEMTVVQIGGDKIREVQEGMFLKLT